MLISQEFIGDFFYPIPPPQDFKHDFKDLRVPSSLVHEGH